MNRIHIKLAIISTVLTLAALTIMPRVPISVDSSFLKLDSSIGGYQIRLFGGKFERDLGEFKRGTDFKGGKKVTLKLNTGEDTSTQIQESLLTTRDIIERRLRLLGLTEFSLSTAQKDNDTQILLNLPLMENIENIVIPATEPVSVKFKKLAPDLVWNDDKFSDYFYTPEVWEDTGVTETDLVGIDVIDPGTRTFDEENPPRLRIRFTDEGRQKFVEQAKSNVDRPLGFFIGDLPYPISMPTVSQDFADGIVGDPIISGNINLTTAKILSTQLETGNLPYQTEVIDIEDIDPNVTPLDVKNNLIVGIISFSLIIMFLLVRYGKAGLLGGISLAGFFMINMSLFKLIPITLSLSSVTGLIVMFLYCVYLMITVLEYIKHELLQDKPKNLSEQISFQRTWKSASITAVFMWLISALFYSFGDLSSREFILVLFSGLITSLFVVFYIFRNLLDSLDWLRSRK